MNKHTKTYLKLLEDPICGVSMADIFADTLTDSEKLQTQKELIALGEKRLTKNLKSIGGLFND